MAVATWTPALVRECRAALEGEGGFAASGTCITVQGKNNVWFGTGGPNGARVFRSSDRGRTWTVAGTPLARGKAAGVFSLTFWSARNGIAVGGDYTKESDAAGNVATPVMAGGRGKRRQFAPVWLSLGRGSCFRRARFKTYRGGTVGH